MVWSFLQSKKESSLGVDIGTSSIKVVELSRGSKGKIELTNYGEFTAGVETSLHTISVKLSTAQASNIIKEIIQETRISEKNTAMSVPIFSGFSTTISLPKMPEAEIEQAVLYEAKKYIPLPLSEVQFEWIKLEDIFDRRKDQTI